MNKPDIKVGEKILINSYILYKGEGWTTNSGKKKWYMLFITGIFEDYFTVSSDDCRYVHNIPFENKKIKGQPTYQLIGKQH